MARLPQLWVYDWRGPHALRALLPDPLPTKVGVVGGGDGVWRLVSHAIPKAEVRLFETAADASGWADLVLHMPGSARLRLRTGVGARRTWMGRLQRLRLTFDRAVRSHDMVIGAFAATLLLA